MAVPLLERTRAMGSRLLRLLADESGVDLIEYMLLATFLAIAGMLGIQVLGTAMNNSYQSWDDATQDAWEVSDPVPAP
jgi:Flp pilus assembly pilin Flp